MRAVDTNVLVRYLAQDDAAQTARATKIIEGGSIFIAKTVILELDWVMRAAYDMPPARVIEAIERLCGLPTVTVEDARDVAFALGCAKAGLDLADALHAVSLGSARVLVTFDATFVKRARRHGITTVEPA